MMHAWQTPTGRGGTRWGLTAAFLILANLAARFHGPPAAESARALDESPVVSVPLSLRIIAPTGSDHTELRSLALTDIEKANEIFADNSAGIVIEAVETIVLEVATASTSVSGCVAGDTLSAPPGQPGILRVYYLSAVGGTQRGFICDDTDSRRYRAAFIGLNNHSATTLAHEIGHVLALTAPGKGHTNGLTGFNAENLMWSDLTDSAASARHWLSNGQVFRMHADAGSWLNRGLDRLGLPLRAPTEARLACQCGLDDPVGACPTLRDTPVPATPVTDPDAQPACHDVVWLPPAEAGSRPVALLAGRRWRDGPGVCSLVASDKYTTRNGAAEFEFENVTRPGSACPSWVVMFAAGKGAYFAPLDELPAVVWSPGADLWPLRFTAAPLRPLELRLFFPASASGRVKADTTEALQVFGDVGRAGIQLRFSPQPSSAACPGAAQSYPPEEAPTSLDVCYGQFPGPGGVSGRTIQLSLANASPLALPHFVGIALGLPPAPTMAGNLMQPTGSKREGKLTLGQLFWLNANLGPEFPNCRETPSPCPPLEFDGVP